MVALEQSALVLPAELKEIYRVRPQRACTMLTAAGKEIPVKALIAYSGSRIWIPLPLFYGARVALGVLLRIVAVSQRVGDVQMAQEYQQYSTYVEMYYVQGVSLEGVAQRLGMSRRTLGRRVMPQGDMWVWGYAESHYQQQRTH